LVTDYGLIFTRRTYDRGIRELLEKEFLYRTVFDGLYFVNIRYMFNGDRLAFVKTYRVKNSDQQAELQFDPLPVLPSE
jgi:hypothetical protein